MSQTATELEWIEATDRHGARLVDRDGGWVAHEGFEGPRLLCDTCSPARNVSGYITFGLPQAFLGFEADRIVAGLGLQDVERALIGLEPGIFAWATTVTRSDNIQPLKFEGVGPPEAVSVAGVAGYARAFRFLDEHQGHASGVVVDNGCLTLFGIFAREDRRPLSTADLKFLESSLAIQRYSPAPRPLPKPPPARTAISADWHLRLDAIRQALGLDPADQAPR